MKKEKGRKSFKARWQRLRSEKRILGLVVMCIALLLVIIFTCIVHISKIVGEFRDTTYDSMIARVELSTNHFAEAFGARSKLIEGASDLLIQKKQPTATEIRDTLLTLESSGRFDYAIYVSNRGIKYRSNGSVVSTRVSLYAEYIDYSKRVFVFRNFDPREMDEELSFASPVVVDGIAIGYIIGSNKTKELFSMFTENPDPGAERYLIDAQGNVMAAIKNGRIADLSGKNLYEDIIRDAVGDQYDADKIIDEIKTNLPTGEINHIHANVVGDSVYVIYKQIPNSDGWAMLYNIKESLLRDSLQSMIIESICTILIIIGLMVLMIFLISRYILHEQKRMYDLAYVDELTKAPNENAFKSRAAFLIKEYPDIPYVMACYDIMNFRYINEGYGHQKADVLLSALVKASNEAYSYNETFARLSADRFICLCVDDGRNEERKKFVLTAVKEAAASVFMNYPIRIKTGLYFVRNRSENISDMIDKANLARKSVDVNRGTMVAEYKDSLMEETIKQEKIESKMETALLNGEFVPFLQPKWDMKHNHICGAEALVRWRTPDGGIVPPGDFIPIFEKNGFVEKIDFYMLEAVCAYLRRMLDENRDVYPISVNQSRYLMYNPEYIPKVQQILLKYNIPKGLVELELTETVFFHEKSHMLEVMNQLKELNINLSIDDFGSGYSSLNLLRDIPFDVLKIDREFLDESAQSDSGKWILRKIVEMAEGLHLRVICEGVETKEHVEMLLDIGCIYAQGYLYSRPIPMEEYIEKYNLIRFDR